MQDSNHLKSAALDLLSSGNSAAAVANILRVTVDRVASWEQEGPEAVVDRTSPNPEVGLAGGSAHHPKPVLLVEPTGFIALPSISRAVFIAFPFATTALVLSFDTHTTLKQLNLLWLYWLALSLAIVIGASSIAYGMRAGFELTTNSILFRNAVATRELAYVDIESYSVVHNAHLDVYVLKFAAKAKADNLEIWLESGLIEGNVARWLATFPCTGCGSVYRGRDPDEVQRDWDTMLSA